MVFLRTERGFQMAQSPPKQAPVSAVKKEPAPAATAAPGAAPAAAAAPAPAKAAKTPKPPKELKRPRLHKFDDAKIITVLKPGSKARGAADRFSVYETGMTIKGYVDKMAAEPWQRTAGQTMADIRWDHDHGFIAIEDHVVPVPPPTPIEKAAAAAPAAE